MFRIFFSDIPERAKTRAAVASMFFCSGLIVSSWATRIIDVKRALSLSDAQVGTALLALPIGQLSAMWFSGYAISKLGSYFTVRFSPLLFALFLLPIPFASSFHMLWGMLFLMGIAGNIQNISINTQGVGVEHLYGRSIMATFHGVWSLSCFFGGIVSSFFVSCGMPMFWHFLITVCAVAFVMALARPYLLKEDPGRKSSPKDEGKVRTSPTPFIFMLGLISFGSMSCEGTMFDWSVIYFSDVVGVSRDFSRFGYVAFMFAMGICRFISDIFVTRFGAARVLIASGFLIFTGMALSVLLPLASVACLGFLMVGAGVSSVVPICYSAAGRSRRMPSSIAIATVSTIGFFGFLMFPPIIGYIADVSSLRFSFALMGCVGLIISAVAPLIRRRLEEK